MATIQKRQSLLVLLALLIPLGLNAAALWRTIGPDTLNKTLNDEYQSFGVPFNPWPEVLKPAFVITVLLGLSLVLAVLSSTKDSFQGQSATKRHIVIIISALLLAAVFGIGTYVIDGIWSSAFFGLPISPFASTNAILAFMATVTISFYTLWLSRGTALTKK
jgi:hypothetical protein